MTAGSPRGWATGSEGGGEAREAGSRFPPSGGGGAPAGPPQDAHVVAHDGLGARARLHREHPQPDAIHADRPPRLRLPPVVDDGNAELLLRPVERVGIAALAGEEERPEASEIVAPHVLAPGIVALDGADS